MKDTPHILCVNPWIHDFAAYDFWAKPLGILSLASILRTHGCNVSYIDCLDRFHPRAPRIDPGVRGGRGPFLKVQIPKPQGLKDVPRNYCRYGIKPSWLRQDLAALPQPDLILITALMTYWYPGLQETIRLIQDVFPDVPMILGGIYATLCSEHAGRYSGADRVLSGAGEARLLDLVADHTGWRVQPNFDPDDLDTVPYPAFDLQHGINYIPLLTSRGCPFSCAYCASHLLSPESRRRSPAHVVEEIRFWHKKHAVSDFVFYDDALLMDAQNHAIPMLEGIIRAGLKIRFHTPNALHIRWITSKTARLMHRAGFETLRLGLETAGFDDRRNLDIKVTADEFQRAIACLKNAGFEQNQIGAYLLVGLPGQPVSTMAQSIAIVKQNGITPVLAHYSPIPHTRLWPEAVASSRYDLASDPVFTNNAVLPCRKESFSWETATYLKNLAAA
jgi:CRISPR-associated DxTHG motif protein